MKDKCVLCKKETLYSKTEHIKFRLGYISGVGQLCLNCYSIECGFVEYVTSAAKATKKTKQLGEI